MHLLEHILIGKVVLEKMLRSLPEIKKIYLLVRPKVIYRYVTVMISQEYLSWNEPKEKSSKASALIELENNIQIL